MTDTGGEALRRYQEARNLFYMTGGEAVANIKPEIRPLIKAADELALGASRGDAPSDTAEAITLLRGWMHAYADDHEGSETDGVAEATKAFLAALRADALTPKDATHE